MKMQNKNINISRRLVFCGTALSIFAAISCGAPKTPVAAGPAPVARDLAKEAADALSDATTDLNAQLAAGEVNPVRVAANLQKVLDLEPANLVALYNMGVLRELEGKNEEAIEFYKKAIAADKTYKPAILNMARLYLLTEHIDDAVAVYKDVINTDNRDWQARLALAQMLFRGEHYQDAIDMSRQVLQRKGDEIEAYRILAESYYHLEEDGMAALIAARGLLIKEHDARLTFLIGRMQQRKGDIPGAVAKYKEAIAADPDWIEARQNKGAISISFRDFNNAAEDFQAVVDKDNTNIPALLGLGIAYKGLKRFEDAEKYYKRILELDAKIPEAHWNLALLYNNDMGRYEDAIVEYKAFKEIAPANSPELKKIDETIATVEQTIAIMKRMEEQKKEQAAYLEKVKETLPQIKEMLAAGNFQEAETALAPFNERSPGDMELIKLIHLYSGQALAGLQKWEESVPHIRWLAGMDAENPEVIALYEKVVAALGGIQSQEQPPEETAAAEGNADGDGASEGAAAATAEESGEQFEEEDTEE